MHREREPGKNPDGSVVCDFVLIIVDPNSVFHGIRRTVYGAGEMEWSVALHFTTVVYELEVRRSLRAQCLREVRIGAWISFRSTEPYGGISAMPRIFVGGPDSCG